MFYIKNIIELYIGSTLTTWYNTDLPTHKFNIINYAYILDKVDFNR